jgi:hypothetical protein
MTLNFSSLEGVAGAEVEGEKESNRAILGEDGTLSLAFSYTEEVPHELARELGPRVTSLNLTECGLKSLRNVHLFSRLKTLVLDKNDLDGFPHCSPIPTLEVLWMNNCSISDLATFFDTVLQLFPSLTEISLMRNPATPGLMDVQQPDLEAMRLYRVYVIWRIGQQLTIVDGDPVTLRERENAALRGPYAIKRRPTAAYKPKAETASLWRRAISAAAEVIVGSSPQKVEHDPEGVTGFSPSSASTKQQVRTSYSRRRYEGRHSEGNRFISNEHL